MDDYRSKGDPLELISFVDDKTMMGIIEEWDRYDTDESGIITEKEFLVAERRIYRNLNCESEISEDELRDKLKFFWRTKDRDGDGEIGWHEFANAKALLALDLNNKLSGCLTQSEMKDARDAFNFIDEDASGVICESEARTYYKTKYERDVANNLRTPKMAMQAVEDSVARLMLSHDSGGDSLISFEEFIEEEAKSIIGDRFKMGDEKESMGASRVHAEEVEDVEEMAQVLTDSQKNHAQIKFQEIDIDGSGAISLKELYKLFSVLNLNMSKAAFRKKLKTAFKEADSDGDGDLTFEEFMTMYNFLYLSAMDMSAFC